jgi:NAD(P)-dependent dehydrogenase (short-subunit alcohol dehydrogenase family)
MKQRFKDKVVLVTGAAMGIGRAAALAYANEGAQVMVSDMNEDDGLNTLKQIQDMGGTAHFFKCDVSDYSEIKNLMKETLKLFGGLDIACNNAGVEGSMGSITDCTLENWDFVMNINNRGLWLCMKEEIPLIEQRGGGAIVNLSSIAGLVGFPGLPAYVASKHAVIGLTKTAALECAPKNIHINAVCPGPILTPMLERLMDTTPGFRDALMASVPQKRIGDVNEVAETILFLSMAESKYITGQALAIDGGMVAQ